MTRVVFLFLLFVVGFGPLPGCVSLRKDTANRMVISVPQQRLVLFRNGEPVAEYPVSTSKFGLGDNPGSYATPLGRMRVAQKIGHGQPLGMVFKSRKPTGEILPPNAPGRDPIVTRILWLEGLENNNRNAYKRLIYIHGTTEEQNIGKPASFGCIRMTSADVSDLFNRVGVGAEVVVTDKKISSFVRSSAREQSALAATGHSVPSAHEKPLGADHLHIVHKKTFGPTNPAASSLNATKLPNSEPASGRNPETQTDLWHRVALLSPSKPSEEPNNNHRAGQGVRRRFLNLLW